MEEIMVVQRGEMKKEVRENMRGGDGSVKLTYLLDGEKETNARMFAEITLEQGCSIGYHQHVNETEYYFILSGNGTVNDDGKDVEVKPGDSIITGHGASHSIKNTGTVPLVFYAVIVTY
jgi:mannose-6-phosphate isomerase-like protein (cupin superfamily)